MLNANLQCHLNQAATCHLKPRWCFRVKLNFTIQLFCLVCDLTQNTLLEWLKMFWQVSLSISYNNCSKKLEYPSRFSKLDRSVKKDSVSSFEGFPSDGVSLLAHEEVFSLREGWWYFFLQRILHSTTTVHRCDSPSPGPTWSVQITSHLPHKSLVTWRHDS